MAEPEIRELRYFHAVATELNFTRAADRLGMAQPPLSRAISRLEQRLGATLFDRGPRRVALTDAGRTLLDEAERVLRAVDTAVSRTRAAAGTRPALVVTAKPGPATAFLQRIVDVYRARTDALDVDLVISGFGEQVAMVLDGRADIAVVGSPYEHPGLDTEPLAHEPRVAALPRGHRLAGRESLRVGDLRDEPMPRWPGSGPAEYWAGLNCEEAARNADAATDGEASPHRPGVGPVVRDSSQLLEVVALGQAVALVTVSLARHNQRDDVAYVPVTDASPYTIALAWSAGATDRRIAGFVTAATDAAPTAHEIAARLDAPRTADA